VLSSPFVLLDQWAMIATKPCNFAKWRHWMSGWGWMVRALPHRMRLRPPVSVCLEEWQPTYRQRHRLHSMISWANNAVYFVVLSWARYSCCCGSFFKVRPSRGGESSLPLTSSSSKCCMTGCALCRGVPPRVEGHSFPECIPWPTCFRLIVDCIRNRVTGCGLY